MSASDQIDDPFQRRLDEINKEMLEILQTSGPTRSPLNPAHLSHNPNSTQAGSNLSSPAAVGAYNSSPNNASSHYIDPNRPLITTSADVLRREVQNSVAREMRLLDERLHERIAKEWDLRVRELDAILRTRFQELRTANESVSAAIIEVTESVQGQVSEIHVRINQGEAEQKRKFTELEREVKQQVREIQIVRDIVNELEAKVRGDARDVDKRVEEMVKRHNDLVRSSLTAIDEKIQSAQKELEDQQRDNRKRYEAELDDVSRSVSRLHATLDTSTSVMDRLVRDVKDVVESAAVNHSATRACRHDVNRLEVAVRGISVDRQMSARTPQASDGAASGLSPADVFRMQQDIFALKECVAYLNSVVSSSAPQNINQQQQHQQQPRYRDDAHDYPLQHARDRFPSNPQQASNVPSPLNSDQLLAASLSKPPYVTSTRSTPTKSRLPYTTSRDGTGGATQAYPDSPLRRDGSYLSETALQSPTYRTVPDSDSEEERENSKLARSELD